MKITKTPLILGYTTSITRAVQNYVRESYCFDMKQWTIRMQDTDALVRDIRHMGV
jgi:hypothetical protein